MKDNLKNSIYDELAAKYFSGNITAAETEQLEHWVGASAQNKKYFLDLRKAWNLANISNDAAHIDLNQAWADLAPHISPKTKVVSMPTRSAYRGWWQVAAAVAVLFIAGWWVFHLSSSPKGLVLFSESEIINEKLDDGSLVKLNRFSQIEYQWTRQGTRQIKLQGDAFFNVARDEAHPFVVQAKEVEVKVLGTSFYVDAREGEDLVQVYVRSGRVTMQVAQQKVLLTKGEVGTYDSKTKKLSEANYNNSNYLAWQSKRLVFEQTPLEKVILDIERTYHADITLQPNALKNCTLTATYENQDLTSVIRIIEKTLNLKATIDGQHIVLSGSPCE